MRIHFFSDRHTDIRGNELTAADKAPVDADLIVCAGDERAPGTIALEELRQERPDSEIVYVEGNHGFYSEHSKMHPELKTTIERQMREMPEVADRLGIHLLQDSYVDLDVAGMTVRIGGGTLWSDFEARPGYLSMNEAMRAAAKAMNDYRLIKVEPGRSRDMLTPAETLGMHRKTVRFLEDFLCLPTHGIDAVIVATHHAPSFRSLRTWDPGHPELFSNLDWCYASDLEYLMTGVRPDGSPMPDGWQAPSLFLHGHIHGSRDYFVGETRVCANPRGYPMEALNMRGRENPDYDPAKTIELEPKYNPGLRM